MIIDAIMMRIDDNWCYIKSVVNRLPDDPKKKAKRSNINKSGVYYLTVFGVYAVAVYHILELW